MTNWQTEHLIASFNPTDDELPMATLLMTAEQLAERYGDDGILRDGIANILLGAQCLLNTDWGRFDRGLLSERINQIADSIGYDIERETF